MYSYDYYHFFYSMYFFTMNFRIKVTFCTYITLNRRLKKEDIAIPMKMIQKNTNINELRHIILKMKFHYTLKCY